MTPALPDALPAGLNYPTTVDLAETIASQTGLRSLPDWELVLRGLGAQISRLDSKTWSDPSALSLSVRAPKDFTVFLPSQPSAFDRFFLGAALAHYILHSQEGRSPLQVRRFAKDQASVEALWFSMGLIIAEAPFRQALGMTPALEDATLAQLFQVPLELIGLKRRLLDNLSRALDRAAQQAPV